MMFSVMPPPPDDLPRGFRGALMISKGLPEDLVFMYDISSSTFVSETRLLLS